MEGGSGRSEASPTAILKDTHSVEGVFSEVRLQKWLPGRCATSGQGVHWGLGVGLGVGRPRSEGSRPALPRHGRALVPSPCSAAFTGPCRCQALSDRPDADFHATSGLRRSKKFEISPV